MRWLYNTDMMSPFVRHEQLNLIDPMVIEHKEKTRPRAYTSTAQPSWDDHNVDEGEEEVGEVGASES
jgi:hypothetical protein